MTLEQTVLFAHWAAAIAALPKVKEAIEHEAKLRKEMMASFFPEPVEEMCIRDRCRGVLACYPGR